MNKFNSISFCAGAAVALLICALVIFTQTRDAADQADQIAQAQQKKEQIQEQASKMLLQDCQKFNGAWMMAIEEDRLIQGCIVPVSSVRAVVEGEGT